MSQTILVTGGTGYIGSHTVVELQQSGFDVVVIDNLSNSYADTLDGIEAITGKRPAFAQVEMCDLSAMREFFSAHPKIAGAIHFAAAKAVGESVQKPLHYYANNLGSLINLMHCMCDKGIAPLVFSSSCTVYGQPEKLPVTEEAPIQKALAPYGNTKQICEEIIQDTIASGADIRGIALRYFNPVGAHPSAQIGELPQGIPNNLVPYITQTAFGVREKLSVYGDDYDTHDGSCIRDYIHVVDLAKAHVIAITRLLEKRNKQTYEIFNLGTGNGYSVFDVIGAFEKACGKPLPYQVVARRPGDIEKIYADTRYANEELGWKAELDLDSMMATSWAWEQHYRNKQEQAQAH